MFWKILTCENIFTARGYLLKKVSRWWDKQVLLLILRNEFQIHSKMVSLANNFQFEDSRTIYSGGLLLKIEIGAKIFFFDVDIFE